MKTLWEGRYKASLVDSEAYLLTCMYFSILEKTVTPVFFHNALIDLAEPHVIKTNQLMAHPLVTVFLDSIEFKDDRLGAIQKLR